MQIDIRQMERAARQFDGFGALKFHNRDICSTRGHLRRVYRTNHVLHRDCNNNNNNNHRLQADIIILIGRVCAI